MELRQHALQVLGIADPEQKATETLAMQALSATYSIAEKAPVRAADAPPLPGHPERPLLVRHNEVAQRSPASLEGRAILIHAIAHIEFNAINLALDAIWRFDGMPRDYYLDWLRVAAEEAKHFNLLRAHDVLARMALVPRTMEARGLDATPLIQAKLRQVGTPDALAAADILEVILREEVGHVAIGNHWYRWLCAQSHLDPQEHYPSLVQQYQAPRLKPPFNEAARREAGFSDAELQWLLQN